MQQQNFSPIKVRNVKSETTRNNADSQSTMFVDHQVPTPIIPRHPIRSQGSPEDVPSLNASASLEHQEQEEDDDASMEPLPFSAAAATASSIPSQQTMGNSGYPSGQLITTVIKPNSSKAIVPRSVTSTGVTPKDPTTTGSKDDDSLDCPHPKDILFPIFGYQLWAGNVRFIRLIKSKRDDFENAPSRSVQATMAIKIMEAVEKDGGRFLTAVETPDNDHAMIVCTTRWRRLNKREILTEIIKFLKRQDTESLREAKCMRRDVRRKKKLELRRTAHKALIEPQMIPSEDETEEYKNEPKGPIPGPLMSLYYVPPFIGGDQDDSNYEEEESLAASDDSTEEEEERPKRKPVVRRPLPKKHLPKRKKAPTKAVDHGAPKIGGFGKPKSSKSLKAAEGEGIIDLPKGVTVRPSGKWQAQTYFAGQSRYVGVYETSRLAAKAYNVVQDFLAEYRNKNKLPRVTPREELAAIFGQARLAAEHAVRGMTHEQPSAHQTY